MVDSDKTQGEMKIFSKDPSSNIHGSNFDAIASIKKSYFYNQFITISPQKLSLCPNRFSKQTEYSNRASKYDLINKNGSVFET